MKKQSSVGFVLIVTAMVGFLAGDQFIPSVEAQEAPAEETETESALSEDEESQPDGPVTTTVLESTLPEDVDPASPFAQLVRMVQAGVDSEVILAYIQKSPRFFELDADDIIYLTDIGTPAVVITAAIERDEQLMDEGIGIESDAEKVSGQADDVSEEQPPEVTVEQFYDVLAPYGSWVYIEGYGRCWRPTVVIYNSGWRPYCDNGRWVYTDRGWYWMSNYSWGWATFHYGRWFNHSRYGWCWWPDSVWAPSWVHWRYNSSYCGWAPLPPYTVYRPGIGICYRGSHVSTSFSFNLGSSAFVFVSTGNLCDANLYRHRIDRRHVPRIYSGTTSYCRFDVDPGRHHLINRGVPMHYIREATHRELKPVSVRYNVSPNTRKSRIERFDPDNKLVIVERPRTIRTPKVRDTRNVAEGRYSSRSTRNEQPRINEQPRQTVPDQTIRNEQPPRVRVQPETPVRPGNQDNSVRKRDVQRPTRPQQPRSTTPSRPAVTPGNNGGNGQATANTRQRTKVTKPRTITPKPARTETRNRETVQSQTPVQTPRVQPQQSRSRSTTSRPTVIRTPRPRATAEESSTTAQSRRSR